MTQAWFGRKKKNTAIELPQLLKQQQLFSNRIKGIDETKQRPHYGFILN